MSANELKIRAVVGAVVVIGFLAIALKVNDFWIVTGAGFVTALILIYVLLGGKS